MTRRRRPRAGSIRRGSALLVLLLAATPAIAAADAAPAPAVRPSAADDQLAAAKARLDAAEARLVALEAERAAIEADHSTLDANQLNLARQLEAALRDTRQFAVEAYVAGGPNAGIGEVLGATEVVDAIWRSEVLAGQTSHGLQRAGELRDLVGRADSAVAQIALRSDQNRRKVEAATLDRFFASLANKTAEQRVAAERAPRPLLVESAPAAPGSLAEAWAKLRNCESSGNYRAISPGGLYRGRTSSTCAPGRPWAARVTRSMRHPPNRTCGPRSSTTGVAASPGRCAGGSCRRTRRASPAVARRRRMLSCWRRARATPRRRWGSPCPGHPPPPWGPSRCHSRSSGPLRRGPGRPRCCACAGPRLGR
jgi:hypothetical protein